MTIAIDTDLHTTKAANELVFVDPKNGRKALNRLERVLAWTLESTDSLTADECVSVLVETINTIDDDGFEGMPYSVGMRWLRSNVEVFAQIMQRSSFEPAGIFRRLIAVPNAYLGGLLYNYKLLGLIDDEDREAFIRELFAAFPPEGNDWIKAFMSVGISREVINEMIVHQLQTTEIDPRYNYAHFVSTFLRDGSGRIQRGFRDYHYLPDGRSAWWIEDPTEVTMWSLLPEEMLIEALLICEAKLPGTLFGKLGNGSAVSQLQARLMDRNTDDEQLEAGRQRIEDLLTAAAAALTPAGFRKASIETLALLPVAEQRKLLVRLEGGSIPFLISLAFQTDDGRELFDKYITGLAQGFGPKTYISLLLQLKENTNRELAKQIEDKLAVLLREAGYELGFVTEGRVPSGRRQGCRQDQVVIGRKTYVHDSYSRDYYPREGDYVIFNKAGRVLTPKVTLVTFMLVKKGAK